MLRMDLDTILVSAAVSAIVGAVVSLLAVSQVTVRQAKAQRAYEAHQAVNAVVEPWVSDVGMYRLHRLSSLERQPDTPHAEDHARVTEVLGAADGLPAWRRWLVRRRLLRLFGPFWLDLGSHRPADTSTLGSSMAVILQAQMHASRHGHDHREQVSGLYHRALSQEPGHPLQDRLIRELGRLAQCR